jgi:hypothetical protein
MTYLEQQKLLVKELENSVNNKITKSTFVEMQTDYANDDQICLTSVVFIPKEISSVIVSKLIESLRKIESEHYYYLPESMHLTIKNVRVIHKPPLFTDEDIEKAKQVFKKTITEFTVYNFSLEDVILFPTSLSLMAYADELHKKLVLALDKGLKEVGVPDDKRYLSDSVFWGNINICRFVKAPGEKFINEVNKFRNIKIGNLKAEKISLITCNAGCSPQTKNIIAEYNLKNN